MRMGTMGFGRRTGRPGVGACLFLVATAATGLCVTGVAASAGTAGPTQPLELHARVLAGSDPASARLEVELRNTGPTALCLSASTLPDWPVADLEATVLDSFGRVGRWPAPVSAPAGRSVFPLAPGARLRASAPIGQAVPAWRNDVYQIVVSLRPSGPSSEAACRPVPDRPVLAPLVEYRVHGVPGQPGIDHYVAQWRSATDADGRFAALRWLARNAMAAGMDRQAVLAVLGPPQSSQSDASRWTYRAPGAMQGIIVRFLGDRVSQVDFFEA